MSAKHHLFVGGARPSPGHPPLGRDMPGAADFLTIGEAIRDLLAGIEDVRCDCVAGGDQRESCSDPPGAHGLGHQLKCERESQHGGEAEDGDHAASLKW